MTKTPYERLKEWRANNPEKVAKQRRRYQIKNWDKIREYQKLWSRAKKAKEKDAAQKESTSVQ